MTNANQDQSEHWNSDATVETWVVGQAAHDAMLAPFLPIMLDAAALNSGEAVLDVGCGCGATTREAAGAVAPGLALGADLSAPMLDRARATPHAPGSPTSSSCRPTRRSIRSIPRRSTW